MPVYIDKAAGAAASGSVTLTATSESDPSKTMSATCTTHRRHRRRHRAGDAGADAWARRPPSARSRPGAQKDYFATTTANVISTAGDATLSVADPSTTATGHLVNGAFSLPEPLQANAVLGTTSAASTRRSAAPPLRRRC